MYPYILAIIPYCKKRKRKWKKKKTKKNEKRNCITFIVVVYVLGKASLTNVSHVAPI